MPVATRRKVGTAAASRMDCTARVHASTSEATMTVKRHEPSSTYTVEP